MRFTKLMILCCSSSMLLSCADFWGKSDEDLSNPYRDMSAQQLYSEAKSALEKKQYESASKRLEAMETMYPFSDNAERAERLLIYAYYKNESYPSAAAAAERYIHLYPRSKDVDYAYYMKGLADFQQNRGTFAKWLPLDESQRDPGSMSVAYSDFSTLVQRFPNSKYKANALQRMIYLRNMFAERELKAADYYNKRKMYVAAIGRADYLVKTYPQAPSAEKALKIMYSANTKLGLKEAADEAARVYAETYHRPVA